MTIPSNEVPRYSRDMSGELPANLVSERVTLTSVNRTDFNIILPRCAPFFHDSVKIKKIETNEILEFGKDFYIGGIFEGITPYTKHNKDVGSIIILLDQWVGGNYDLVYQTVGGDYVLDEEHYQEALKNASINPILVRWEELHHKPIEFPPLPHEHETSGTYEYDDFINELSRLRQGIEKWLIEDQKDAPSYAQVLQLLFEQGRLLNLISARMSQVQDDLSSSTAGAIDRALKKVETLSKEAERIGKTATTAVETKVSEVKRELVEKITSTTTEIRENSAQTNKALTDQIAALESQLNTKIKEALDKLAKASTSQGEDLNRLRGELTASVQNLVDTNAAALNKLKKETEQRVNVVVNRSVKLDAEEQAIAGKLKAKQFDSDKVGHDTTYTKYVTDSRNGDKLESYVQGNKRAEQDDKLLNVLTPAQVAARLSMKPVNSTNFAGLRLNGDNLEYVKDGINLKDGTGNPVYGNMKAADFIYADGTSLNDKFVPYTGGNMKGALRLFTSNPFDENWNETDVRWGYSGFLRPNQDVTDDSNRTAQGQLQIRVVHPHHQGKALPGALSHGRTIEFNYGSHGDLRIWTGGWDQYGHGYRRLELLTYNHITNDPASNRIDRVMTASAVEGKIRNALGSLNTQETYLPKSLTHYPIPNHWESIELMKGKIPFIHSDGKFFAGYRLHLKPPPGHAEPNRFVYLEWAKDDAHGGDGIWCSGWMSVHHLQVRSDQRLKREIKPIYNALEKVSALHGYTYQMKNEPHGRHAGVMAQEVLAVLPEAVSKNNDGYLEVDYNGVLSLLLEAVNELREENHVLKERIRKLEEV